MWNSLNSLININFCGGCLNPPSLFGRRRVSTLLKRMKIPAIYRQPNISKRYQAHPVYTVFVAEFDHNPFKPCLGRQIIAYIPMKCGFVQLFAVID